MTISEWWLSLEAKQRLAVLCLLAILVTGLGSIIVQHMNGPHDNS